VPDLETTVFVGLGNMGWPMAANLVRAGRVMAPVDVSTSRQQAFRDDFPAAVDPATLDWSTVGTVITMLPTGKEVREVLLEEGVGLASRLRAGSVVIDMSSAEPIGTRELGVDLAALGVDLVDAPVSGGVPRAGDGTLTIMVGSDSEAAVARARPLLEILGATIFETGSVGSGHATKALNNYVAAAGFVAASEALVVGKRFGLDPATLISVLNVSTGRNFSTDFTIKEHVLTGLYKTGFSLGLMTKDVGIADDLGHNLEVPNPVCDTVVGQLRLALEALGPSVDHSEAVRYWEARE
jgi:3-hydroxyisobutyrate dehydrogenase